MIRFFIFLIIFALVFAFFSKWIILFFKRFVGKESRLFEDKYNDQEFDRKRCRSLTTHNIVKGRCKWCGKSTFEIGEENKKDKVIDFY